MINQCFYTSTNLFIRGMVSLSEVFLVKVERELYLWQVPKRARLVWSKTSLVSQLGGSRSDAVA